MIKMFIHEAIKYRKAEILCQFLHSFTAMSLKLNFIGRAY